MNFEKKYFKHIFGIFLICSFLLSCTENKISLEDEIKQYIKAVKQAAENRSHSNLARLVHTEYADQQGLNKQQITKMLRAYFFRHKNIYLLTKIEHIVLQNDNKAFIRLYVAMTSHAISDINSLASLKARIYEFELQLVKENEWLLQQAKWQQASIQEMI